MEKLSILKIGGNCIEDKQLLASFLKAFAEIPHKKILVHGGGNLANKLSQQLGIRQQMRDGRRITGPDTLRVVTMVYAGEINKNIVADLQALQCNAIGLTGADANLLPASKREIKDNTDYGFVGDIVGILPQAPWKLFLDNGLTPVMAAITHDRQGQLLNTNADTIAREIARALSRHYAVELIYLFEKHGVLENREDPGSVLAEIDRPQFETLKACGKIVDGMIPKLENAFEALDAGVTAIHIGHPADLTALLNGNAGTRIVLDTVRPQISCHD